jgi:ribosomal protein L35
MPKKGDVHVVYRDAAKRWRVEVTGNKRASGTHTAKGAAVDQGRRLATRKKSELVVHKQDGKIGERRSYGNDPFPPRG